MSAAPDIRRTSTVMEALLAKRDHPLPNKSAKINNGEGCIREGAGINKHQYSVEVADRSEPHTW